MMMMMMMTTVVTVTHGFHHHHHGEDGSRPSVASISEILIGFGSKTVALRLKTQI